MKHTDPTLKSIMTPYPLTKQLRLLMRDRDTDIATLQVMGEMMSQRYLESLRDDTLISMIDGIVRSVNDIIATLIVDRISGSGYRRVGIGDVVEQQGRLLQDARYYTEQAGIVYEIVILRRIAYDVMAILSQRREEADNE